MLVWFFTWQPQNITHFLRFCGFKHFNKGPVFYSFLCESLLTRVLFLVIIENYSVHNFPQHIFMYFNTFIMILRNCVPAIVPCPLLPSPVLFSLPLPPHQAISMHSTGDPVLDLIRKFYPHRAASHSASKRSLQFVSLFTDLWVCVCVFQYHSSEIAPSKRASGVRLAPGRTTADTPNDSDISQGIHSDISMWVKVRDERKEEKNRAAREGKEMREGLKGWFLFYLESLWHSDVSSCLWRKPGGLESKGRWFVGSV